LRLCASTAADEAWERKAGLSEELVGKEVRERIREVVCTHQLRSFTWYGSNRDMNHEADTV
jgi:hypothetical protein